MTKIKSDKNSVEYQEALDKVKNLKSFYTHACIFVIVNLFLLVLNLSEGGADGYWFIWPLFGWGVGLFAHWFSTTDFTLFSSDWEEKKLGEYLNKKK